MTIQGFRITNKGRAALIAMKENAKQDEEVPAHYRIADALAEAGLLAPEPDGEAMSYEYAVQYQTPDGWKYSRESWDCRWQESEAAPTATTPDKKHASSAASSPNPKRYSHEP